MRLSLRGTVLLAGFHVCVLSSAPAFAQNWNFDARNVGRDNTNTGSAFITDVRNGELSRDLNEYRGFSPQTSVVAEGLALAELGPYLQVPP